MYDINKKYVSNVVLVVPLFLTLNIYLLETMTSICPSWKIWKLFKSFFYCNHCHSLIRNSILGIISLGCNVLDIFHSFLNYSIISPSSACLFSRMKSTNFGFDLAYLFPDCDINIFAPRLDFDKEIPLATGNYISNGLCNSLKHILKTCSTLHPIFWGITKHR